MTKHTTTANDPDSVDSVPTSIEIATGHKKLTLIVTLDKPEVVACTHIRMDGAPPAVAFVATAPRIGLRMACINTECVKAFMHSTGDGIDRWREKIAKEQS